MQAFAIKMVVAAARGWVRPLLLAATAGGTGFGALWSASDYRIEQTADGSVCGVERNFLAFERGILKGRKSTLEQACQALFEQPPGTCPVIGPRSWSQCAPFRPPGLAERVRMTRTLPRQAVPATDTGWLALVRDRGMHVLIGGTQVIGARAADFPAMLYVQGSRGSCLASVVGPKVVLTAAHCVAGSSPTVDWQCGGSSTSLTLTCTPVTGRYPQHAGACPETALVDGCEQDVQLCFAAQELTCPGFTAEVVDTSGRPPNLVLTGAQDGPFAYGPAVGASGPDFSSPSVGNRFVTATSPTLSDGDSGAPTFDQSASAARSIVAVNSRTSPTRLTALWGMKTELAAWAKNEGLVVCGVDSGTPAPAGACRR